MSVKIRLLRTVLVNFRVTLVIHLIILTIGEVILWLYDATALSGQSFEYWSESLRFWDHLGSRFLSRVNFIGVSARI